MAVFQEGLAAGGSALKSTCSVALEEETDLNIAYPSSGFIKAIKRSAGSEELIAINLEPRYLGKSLKNALVEVAVDRSTGWSARTILVFFLFPRMLAMVLWLEAGGYEASMEEDQILFRKMKRRAEELDSDQS
jgi:hypothetical protein